MLAFGARPLPAQMSAKSTASSATVPGKAAAVKSFRVIQEADGPAVEILSTLPLIPEISVIENPSRLVIDLPHARIDVAQKRIDVGADQITALRASQFQQAPPVARIVVDLEAPRTFSWQAAGNRLVIHLGKNPSAEGNSPFEPATTPTLTPAPKPVSKQRGPLDRWRFRQMPRVSVHHSRLGRTQQCSAYRVAASCVCVLGRLSRSLHRTTNTTCCWA